MKKVLQILFVLLLVIVSGCEEGVDYQKEIEELNAEISELQESTTSLQQDKQEMKVEINQLKEENNELIDKLNRINDKRLNKLKQETGLVNIKDIDDSIIVDLRYATEDNFVNKRVYPVEIALLQEDTALKLKEANEQFKKDGYRIKLWDGYRPFDVQQVFWDLTPDKDYLADPSQGSHHNRGAAVDITLVDEEGNELEMPTGFDEFSNHAWRSYQGNSSEAQKNMEYLTGVMVDSGFTTINIEWWHYNDSRARNYPVLNVPLEEFSIKEY